MKKMRAKGLLPSTLIVVHSFLIFPLRSGKSKIFLKTFEKGLDIVTITCYYIITERENLKQRRPGRAGRKDDIMKTFEINGTEYTVETCTAICSADMNDENRRQDALLVSSENGGEKSKFVVFGWEMPETTENFSDMCDDSSAWESDHEVLDTVKK